MRKIRSVHIFSSTNIPVKQLVYVCIILEERTYNTCLPTPISKLPPSYSTTTSETIVKVNYDKTGSGPVLAIVDLSDLCHQSLAQET
jgi:hypothetical protein